MRRPSFLCLTAGLISLALHLSACGAMTPGAFMAKGNSGTSTVVTTGKDGEDTPDIAGPTLPPGSGPDAGGGTVTPPPAGGGSGPGSGGSGTGGSATYDTTSGAPKIGDVASAGDTKSFPVYMPPAGDCFDHWFINFIRKADLASEDDNATPFNKDETNPTDVSPSATGTFGGPYLVSAEVPDDPRVDPPVWKTTNELRGYVRLIVTPAFGGAPQYMDAEIGKTELNIVPVPLGKMRVLRSNVVINEFPVDSGSTILAYYFHVSGIGWKENNICMGSVRQPPDYSPALKPYTDAVKANWEAQVSRLWFPDDPANSPGLVTLLAVMKIPMPVYKKMDGIAPKVDLRGADQIAPPLPTK